MISAVSLPLRAAFRVDASLEIGTGHVMRCLTLADALRDQGAQSLFVCRPHEGHLLEVIAQRGHRSIVLPALANGIAQDAADPAHAHWLGTDWATDAADTLQALAAEGVVDWLVLDHYALDRRWEEALRPACRWLMVMDDLADRPHDCDLLLDPSLGRTVADYAGLLPLGSEVRAGPQHALLRPEFAQLRAESLARRGVPRLRKLLITMGGVDKDNITSDILDVLDACEFPPDLTITVVMGPYAPWLSQVRERAARMLRPTQVLVGVDNMARLMTDSDLAIGAAGSTTWERCCLGLPAIQLVLADNQREVAMAFSELGAAIGVPTTEGLSNTLPPLIAALRPDQLQALSEQSARICDGRAAPIAAEWMLREADTARRVA